jgi:hypothetical protein
MAYEIPGVVASFLSGSTTLTQYKICRLSAANTVVHTTGISTGTAAIISLGVIQSAPAASTVSTGQVCTVMISGITKVLASSAAIAAGNYVRATSGAAGTVGGRARASSNSSPRIVGIALTSCAASTKARYISMRLF